MSKRPLFVVLTVAGTLCAAVALGQQPGQHSAMVAKGEQVFDHWCMPCHGPGKGMPGFDHLPGTQQLGIKYRNTDIPAVLSQRTDLVPEYIGVVVRNGVSFMPQFRKTEVSDEDLEAIKAYLTRNNPKTK